jgi:hypothetical protein
MVICALLLVLLNMQMSLGLGLTPFVLRVPAIPQLGGLNAAVECFIENHYVRNDASCRIISIATSGLISMCRVSSRLPLGMSALRYADPTLPTITNLPSAAAICAIENIWRYSVRSCPLPSTQSQALTLFRARLPPESSVGRYFSTTFMIERRVRLLLLCGAMSASTWMNVVLARSDATSNSIASDLALRT